MPPEAAAPPAFLRCPGEARIAAAFLAIFFALQLHLALVLNINWDEFLFLSHVYSFQDGRLNTAFQTFHVHLFGWLTALPLTEPGQIVFARLIMLLAETGTAACIFLVARSLVAERHALFAVLAYLGSGFVMGHGASFRADPMATFLMMASLALLFAAPRTWPYAVLASIPAGLALLVTVKSALYFPACLAALVQALRKEPVPARTIGYFLFAGACCAIVYGLGMLAHAAATGEASAAGALHARTSDALDKTRVSQALFPQKAFIARWILSGLMSAMLLIAGIALALAALWKGSAARAAIFLLLAAPLLSLAIYRNAFPYFFPFIMAPASVVIGLVSERVRRAPCRNAVIAVMLATIAAQYGVLIGRDQSTQRAIIATIHQLFPEPVPYIDRNSMVPSFPKVGIFMSTWGLGMAAASGQSVLRQAIADQHPPLLIVNSPAIAKALDPAYDYPGHRLTADDARALRDNYIPHWGPIWVAGHALTATGDNQPFMTALPGRYTIMCTGDAIRLDNARRTCGSVVGLAAGGHRISGTNGQRIVLRWGDHLRIPGRPAPEKPIYYDF